MRYGSLFSGIGGLDLGLDRAGMECAWQVEIDPFCRKVLEKHWPDVPKYGDIKELSGDELEPVDLIAGGFPCQPVSTAGKKLGDKDARWLWPEFLRIIRTLRPRYVLVENVPGLFLRGFGGVLGGLAESGYDAEWNCLSAAAMGAPHRRDRVWILAYPNGSNGRAKPGEQQAPRPPLFATGSPPNMADAEGQRQQWAGAAWERGDGLADGGKVLADAASERRARSGQPLDAGDPETDSEGQAGQPINVSLGSQWATEPDVGRVANGVPRRVDRLKGLGNAVVPQVAQWIGERILMADQ